MAVSLHSQLSHFSYALHSQYLHHEISYLRVLSPYPHRFRSVGDKIITNKFGNIKYLTYLCIMKNFKLDGFQYNVIIKRWKKRDSRFECIKHPVGNKTEWERIPFQEFKNMFNKFKKSLEISNI